MQQFRSVLDCSLLTYACVLCLMSYTLCTSTIAGCSSSAATDTATVVHIVLLSVCMCM